jgi:hypothetical protein
MLGKDQAQIRTLRRQKRRIPSFGERGNFPTFPFAKQEREKAPAFRPGLSCHNTRRSRRERQLRLYPAVASQIIALVSHLFRRNDVDQVNEPVERLKKRWVSFFQAGH